MFRKRSVRVRVVRGKPNGGFTFVFGRLEQEARYVRQHSTEAVGLLVVVDGDQAGFQRRLAEIQGILHKAGFSTKKPDRIAVCVPSRNVETWNLWLCGIRDLDEQANFKNRFRNEVKHTVRRGQLAEAWLSPLSEEQRQTEETTLPALASGRAEIDRLKKLAKS
ncbi:MAG TPA: hypothetical protein VH988_10905 [Thermoanaerobaculia bacterium]|nr:hypothetical protein [Thermoanaerobaculia bacterium]